MKGKKVAEEPIEVTITLPGPDAPGFLKRIREVSKIYEDSPSAAAAWEGFGAYLVEHGYVQCPPGIDPHDAAAELPQQQLLRAARILMGNAPEDTPAAVPPTNDA